jgi:hypothetical protein
MDSSLVVAADEDDTALGKEPAQAAVMSDSDATKGAIAPPRNTSLKMTIDFIRLQQLTIQIWNLHDVFPLIN